MINPLSASTRRKIYLSGITLSIFIPVLSALLVALAVSSVWVAVVTAFLGAYGVWSNTVSKDNISYPETAESDGSSLEVV